MNLRWMLAEYGAVIASERDLHDSSSDSVLRLDDEHIGATGLQETGSVQSCRAGADDNDAVKRFRHVERKPERRRECFFGFRHPTPKKSVERRERPCPDVMCRACRSDVSSR